MHFERGSGHGHDQLRTKPTQARADKLIDAERAADLRDTLLGLQAKAIFALQAEHGLYVRRRNELSVCVGPEVVGEQLRAILRGWVSR